jgi:hypothetical protein
LPANAPISIDPSRWPLAQPAGLEGHEEFEHRDSEPRSTAVAKASPRPSVSPHGLDQTRAARRELARASYALEWARTTTLYTEDKALNLVRIV